MRLVLRGEIPGFAYTICLYGQVSIPGTIIYYYRVFTNGLGDLSSIPGRMIQKILKMVLDNCLLNTQQYKERIKGKVGQSRERSSAIPYILV